MSDQVTKTIINILKNIKMLKEKKSTIFNRILHKGITEVEYSCILKQFYEKGKKKELCKSEVLSHAIASCYAINLALFFLHTTHTRIQIPHSHKTDHSPLTQSFSHIQNHT